MINTKDQHPNVNMNQMPVQTLLLVINLVCNKTTLAEFSNLYLFELVFNFMSFSAVKNMATLPLILKLSPCLSLIPDLAIL